MNDGFFGTVRRFFSATPPALYIPLLLVGVLPLLILLLGKYSTDHAKKRYRTLIESEAAPDLPGRLRWESTSAGTGYYRSGYGNVFLASSEYGGEDAKSYEDITVSRILENDRRIALKTTSLVFSDEIALFQYLFATDAMVEEINAIKSYYDLEGRSLKATERIISYLNHNYVRPIPALVREGNYGLARELVIQGYLRLDMLDTAPFGGVGWKAKNAINRLLWYNVIFQDSELVITSFEVLDAALESLFVAYGPPRVQGDGVPDGPHQKYFAYLDGISLFRSQNYPAAIEQFSRLQDATDNAYLRELAILMQARCQFYGWKKLMGSNLAAARSQARSVKRALLKIENSLLKKSFQSDVQDYQNGIDRSLALAERLADIPGPPTPYNGPEPIIDIGPLPPSNPQAADDDEEALLDELIELLYRYLKARRDD